MSSLRGRVDVSEFRALVGKTSQLEPKLRTALRRRIRDVASRSAQDIKTEVMKDPESGGKSGRHTGLREKIAAGVTVKIMAGKKAGVTIQASASALPPSQKTLVRAYGKPKGWRHPDFGHDPWTTQIGRPRFFAVVGRRRAEFTTAVKAAMTEAAQTLK